MLPSIKKELGKDNEFKRFGLHCFARLIKVTLDSLTIPVIEDGIGTLFGVSEVSWATRQRAADYESHCSSSMGCCGVLFCST